MSFSSLRTGTGNERRTSVLADARRVLADDPFRRILVCYLGGVLVLLPLPFGGWRDWAVNLVGILTAAMLGLLAWHLAAGRAVASRLNALAVPAVLYGLVLIWALLQADTSGLLRAVHHPYWADASAALGQPLASSISLDRYETWRGFVSLAGYGGIFLLAVYAAANIRIARLLAGVFVWAAAAYALYGLFVYFSGLTVVLWFEKDVYRNVVTATFDNRNNFATYVGMALIAAAGLFLNEVSRQRRRPVEQAGLVAVDRLWRVTWPLVAVMGILATALFLTASRAGAIATLVGLVVLLGGIFLTRGVRPFRPRGLIAGFAVIVAGLVYLSGDATTERVLRAFDAEDERFEVFRSTVAAIRDSALTGTGLGTFEDAFRLYRSTGIEHRFAQAHNDVLENVLELGLPGATALFAAVLLVVVLCIRELRTRRRGAIFPCIAVAASAQVGLHSLFDFGLQVPAVTVAYAVLLALGLVRTDRAAGGKSGDDAVIP